MGAAGSFGYIRNSPENKITGGIQSKCVHSLVSSKLWLFEACSSSLEQLKLRLTPISHNIMTKDR